MLPPPYGRFAGDHRSGIRATAPASTAQAPAKLRITRAPLTSWASTRTATTIRMMASTANAIIAKRALVVVSTTHRL